MVLTSRIQSFLKITRRVFSRCRAEVKGGLAFYASPPDSQYPYIYTRDLSIALNLLSELSDYSSAKACCEALISFQSGGWVQKYSAEGKRKDDIVQEDNTPLAVWAILSYVTASGDADYGRRVERLVTRACDLVCGNLGKSGLVRSHTSIHESEINNGYELWNNSASARALELAGQVYGIERHSRSAGLIKGAIATKLVRNGKLIRRVRMNGTPDLMPDVMLLAPFYFGIMGDRRLLKNALEAVERLRDPMGGYHRYPPESRQKGIVTLFPGPWVFYTAWVAQMYFALGMRARAEDNLDWIFRMMTPQGLPEHVISSETFFRCKAEQLRRLKRLEAVRELKEYVAAGYTGIDRMELIAAKGRIVPYSVPTLWSHVETLRALKAGGYIKRFKAF
ncbi:MAG: hypothetical protein ABH879_02655 [archaeon]